MRGRGLWTIALMTLFVARTAAAQVVFEPRPLRVNAGNEPDPRDVPVPCRRSSPSARTERGTPPRPPALSPAAAARQVKLAEDPLGELNREYHKESWAAVQESARYLLDQMACAAGKDDPDAAAYDYATNFIVLNWIGADSFGTYSIHRLLVSSVPPAPFKTDLPGIDKYYEILLSNYKETTVTTVLTSTEVADPVLAQIPDVAARVLPALFGLIAGVEGTANARANQPAAVAATVEKKAVIRVTPFEVDLPARRATIALNSILTEPISQDDFKAGAARVASRTGFQGSACAHTLAEADRAAAVTAVSNVACAAGKPRGGCLDVFHEAFVKEFNNLRATTACSTEASVKPMTTVDEAFRTFVSGNLEREVKTQVTFANTPPRHYSFGLLEAVAFGAWVNEPRVKLNKDGVITSDPMPRLLTIVTLNRSFSGYDPSTVTPTSHEKSRAFVGGVITPDFGLAGGLSWLPVRGFAVNAGVGLLFPKTLGKDNVIGEEPKNTKDPFGLGTAFTVFAGAAYNFK